MLKKVDATGNHVKFPGVTIIAPIVKTDPESEFLHNIHHFLSHSTLFTTYYAPLPYDSYHMTTCNLYTQDKHQDWHEFITGKLEFFQNLCTYLKDREFNPEISLEGLEFGGALQLRLTVPESQKKLFHDLAQTFDIENGIPPFFHITLAYSYKDIDNEQVRREMIATLEEVIAPYINQKIRLDIPTLCYFESMKAFTPWDGKTYPFNDNYRSKKVTGFFNTTEGTSSKQLSEATDRSYNNQSL